MNIGPGLGTYPAEQLMNKYSVYMHMVLLCSVLFWLYHDDVIKWEHFPRY